MGLEAVFSDLETAKRIGHVYLAAYPEDRSLNGLAVDFMGSNTHYDTGRLRKKIADLRVRDFTIADTIIVEGWILARVEARICALLWLL